LNFNCFVDICRAYFFNMKIKNLLFILFAFFAISASAQTKKKKAKFCPVRTTEIKFSVVLSGQNFD